MILKFGQCTMHFLLFRYYVPILVDDEEEEEELKMLNTVKHIPYNEREDQDKLSIILTLLLSH